MVVDCGSQANTQVVTDSSESTNSVYELRPYFTCDLCDWQRTFHSHDVSNFFPSLRYGRIRRLLAWKAPIRGFIFPMRPIQLPPFGAILRILTIKNLLEEVALSSIYSFRPWAPGSLISFRFPSTSAHVPLCKYKRSGQNFAKKTNCRDDFHLIKLDLNRH